MIVAKLRSRRFFQSTLLGAPLLLLMPALYYSLTTPFSLVDDYLYGENLRDILVFNDLGSFLGWLHRNFLSSEIWRFRPFWELANGFALVAYGTTPVLHHLSRWILHLASVAMFVLAAAVVLGGERSGAGTKASGFAHSSQVLVPIALMVYIWLFFPNFPVSRLQPQEVHTVFFLGLCNWMAALLLVEPAMASPVRAYLTRTLLCLACLGISWSKEVNVGIAACPFLFQLALLFWQTRRVRLEIASSLLLLSIFALAALRVYTASRNAGVGYGEVFNSADLLSNVKSVIGGLFQGRTSLLITAYFFSLGVMLCALVVRRWWQRGLDRKLIFLAFLFAQFATLFLALCFSYDVALRYWYPLIPLLATSMAFASYFIVGAASGKSEATARVTKVCLVAFIGFYIACNYSNFLFQTIVQHSASTLEQRTIEEVTRLLKDDQPVWIVRTGDEYEDKLIGNFNEGSFFTTLEAKHDLVFTWKPVALPYYHEISRSMPAEPSTLVWSADNRRSYELFSMASAVAAFLQGGEPYLSRDAGVASFHRYRWNIYRVTGEDRPRIIDAEFDIYFDRPTRSLVYVKSPCAPEDAHVRFYLHVAAQDRRDFPTERSKRLGVEELGFDLKDKGGRVGDDCIAHIKLPSYAIYSLSTGRVEPDRGRIWSEDFFFYERGRGDATGTTKIE